MIQGPLKMPSGEKFKYLSADFIKNWHVSTGKEKKKY